MLVDVAWFMMVHVGWVAAIPLRLGHGSLDSHGNVRWWRYRGPELYECRTMLRPWLHFASPWFTSPLLAVLADDQQILES